MRSEIEVNTMAVLIGMSADVKGKNFSIDKSPFTIGRVEDNAAVIDIVGVSSHHCEIVTEGDRYILRDLGSTNGTRVNNKDVKEHTLRPKDLIAFGTVEFLFNAEGATDDAGDAGFPQTEVVVAEGGAEQPADFNSISPFGARRRESTGKWTIVLILIGILAVLGVLFFLYKLFMG
jgi:pSer/pThr/pTyr-binding forkhead associated (FHA) protein